VEAPSTSWIAWISRAANPFSTQTTTVTKLWTRKVVFLIRCADAQMFGANTLLTSANCKLNCVSRIAMGASCSQFYFACLGFRRAADARRAGQAAEVSKEGRRRSLIVGTGNGRSPIITTPSGDTMTRVQQGSPTGWASASGQPTWPSSRTAMIVAFLSRTRALLRDWQQVSQTRRTSRISASAGRHCKTG